MLPIFSAKRGVSLKRPTFFYGIRLHLGSFWVRRRVAESPFWAWPLYNYWIINKKAWSLHINCKDPREDLKHCMRTTGARTKPVSTFADLWCSHGYKTDNIITFWSLSVDAVFWLFHKYTSKTTRDSSFYHSWITVYKFSLKYGL